MENFKKRVIHGLSEVEILVKVSITESHQENHLTGNSRHFSNLTKLIFSFYLKTFTKRISSLLYITKKLDFL